MSIIAAKPPRFAGSDPFIESGQSARFGRPTTSGQLTESDRSGRFGRFADPGRSAEASQSDGSSEPVGVDRPPGSILARVRVPAPSAVEPDAFPSASPERPWDRVAIVVAREDPRFREESMELKDPLPDRAPDGSSLVGAIVIRTVEVLLGHRPASSVRQWLAPEVFAPLVRRAGLAYRINGRAQRRQAPRILHILANRPLARVIEAVAAVHDGERVRAACVRMEYLRGRWRAVALEIG